MGAGCSTVIKVDGVGAVQVVAVRDEGGLGVPESTSVVVRREPKIVRVLTEAVYVGVLREVGPQLKILGLEDQG
jgi:hypothetical protein